MRFTWLSVALTPGFLALAALLVAIGLSAAQGRAFAFSRMDVGLGFTTGPTMMLVAALVGWRQQARPAAGDGPLMALAAVLVAVAWWLALRRDHMADSTFWLGFAVLAVAVLLLLGRHYQARESYRGLWDDALFDPADWARGDIDRAHMWLGVAIAGPELLLAAWGGIASGRWLWRDFPEGTLDAVSDALALSVAGDAAAARRRLFELPIDERRRAGVLLVKMGLCKPGPELLPTLKAKELFAGAVAAP